MKLLFWNIRGMKKASGKNALRVLVKEKDPDILCIAEPMIEHISVSITWDSITAQISFVHASSFRAERRSLWMKLMADSPQSPTPWVIMGDFNATLQSHEKRGPGNFSMGSAAEFGAMVDACVMAQVPSFGLKFTWSNNRRRGNVHAVLDRSFCNDEWISQFQDCAQTVLDRIAFDHAPIMVQLDIEANGLDDHSFAGEADAKTSLIKALDLHEKLWVEKAKIRWMKQGDRNSKFFHFSAKMRRIRNTIRCLKKQDGTIVEGREQLGDYIVQFYEDFHKATPTIDHVDLLDSIPMVLQQNDIFFLDSIPSDEEIKKAIWELDPDSSPGPDGFTGAFFRRCWNIVEREFGFSEKWVTWLHQMLISTKISIMVNGGPQGYFDVERGLRQGDPISPLLFIIAEEVLSRGIKSLIHMNKLKPLQGPRGVPTRSHILFADDIFIFSNATMRKQCISDILGILVCNFPTKYLGVEIFKGRIKKDTLFPIMDKIKSRLAGEIDMVRSITVKWDTLCKPKEEGGLGIRRLRDSNKAMLCKLVWRMRKEKSTAAAFLRARKAVSIKNFDHFIE
ncbi:uncharacterized protein LOC122063975 [Macadamia integrifolia]|uniref:uncharacterized protein LOC122063975 n=1 Tax=Macadamia integrifolia TaxID=60698 RepID=UPI001C4F1A0D|nr:uncharacterized protein LOC122063975 [Macadamia integrifolia]